MIHHHPPPTRGCTMKFTRRHDLDPHTRIEIVRHVWIHQGIYGQMTQIAQDYHISRTFLYQLSWAAKHHLEDLFRASITASATFGYSASPDNVTCWHIMALQ